MVRLNNDQWHSQLELNPTEHRKKFRIEFIPNYYTVTCTVMSDFLVLAFYKFFVCFIAWTVFYFKMYQNAFTDQRGRPRGVEDK